MGHPHFYNFRRWVIVTLGKNPNGNRYCVWGDDHDCFSRHLHFGSLDIRNIDVAELTALYAKQILKYHSHQDVFVMLMHDVNDTSFRHVLEEFRLALEEQKINGQFCLGKLCYGSVQVLAADGKVFIPAQKPERCPNWDPRRSFQMPNGSLLKGISIPSVA